MLEDGCRKYADIVNEPQLVGVKYENTISYYDDQMQYIYCINAKVGSTNWRATLAMLTGLFTKYGSPEEIPRRVVYIFKFKKLDTLLNNDRMWRLRKYFKFVFVREPLERLLSAYRDKVETNAYRRMVTNIVRKCRPHDYKSTLKQYNVTFAEFVRYILIQHAAGRGFNIRWIPQYLGCAVCTTAFNFFGHYETLHKDAEFVVSELKSRIRNQEQRRRVVDVTFPADRGHSRTNNLMQRMYSTIPAADIQALFKLYAIDYALFGFNRPNVTGFY